MANRVLKWLILLAFILFIVSILSFWFRSPSFSESGVILELNGPNQASVGDEVVYKLKYENKTKSDLHNLRFTFSYPEESVILKDSEVAVDTGLNEKFNLELLKSGQSEEKEFHAFLVGDKGNIKTAKIEVLYQAENLKSEFQKEKEFSTTITGLPISLVLVAPPNLVSGQEVSYILDYRNQSGETISDLRFEFDYPEGFSQKSFSPLPSQGNSIWTVANLKKDKGSRITISGILTGREGETKPISVVLKRKVGSKYVNYEKASSASVLATPLLNVSVLVNGSREYNAVLGDQLAYTVDYGNNSNFNLSGLSLLVKLEGDMYDFSSLNTGGGFFSDSDKTILWNAGSIDNFSNFRPRDDGQITFKIKLKENFSGSKSANSFFVKSTAVLSTANVPASVGSSNVSAEDSVTTRITTQPSFKQSGYYNDPVFGSSGLFPPKAGEETVYTVHWQISNPGNNLNQARLSAVLPAGAIWKNIVGVGLEQPEPVFNAASSEVVWNIQVVPQGVGILNPKYEASFQIGITPSSNQVGQILDLIKNAKLTGMDSFTGQNISISAPNLTSNDLIDKPNTGTVQ